MVKKIERMKVISPDLAFDPVEAALRQLFEEMSAEEIPDDFMALVAQLDNQTQNSEPK